MDHRHNHIVASHGSSHRQHVEPHLWIEIQHNWKFLLTCLFLFLAIVGAYVYTYYTLEKELDPIQQFTRLTVSDGVYVGGAGSMLRQIQKGVVTVPVNTEESEATVSVTFPQGFASTPAVFTSVSMNTATPFTDVVAVVHEAGKESMHITVRRVGSDNPKLTAPLTLSWLAVL